METIDIAQIVNDLIYNKITKEEISKKYKIDIRTLNKRIAELKDTNPKLYFTYTIFFPITPNKNEHLDYEAMVIELLKTGETRKSIAEKYGITIRSFAIKIKELQEKNPELINLYRTYSQFNVGRLKLSEQAIRSMQEQIEKLKIREVSNYKTAKDKKREDLEKLKKKFLTLKEEGQTQKQISDELEMDYSTITKNLQLLKMIEEENELKANGR